MSQILDMIEQESLNNSDKKKRKFRRYLLISLVSLNLLIMVTPSLISEEYYDFSINWSLFYLLFGVGFPFLFGVSKAVLPDSKNTFMERFMPRFVAAAIICNAIIFVFPIAVIIYFTFLKFQAVN